MRFSGIQCANIFFRFRFHLGSPGYGMEMDDMDGMDGMDDMDGMEYEEGDEMVS